LIATKLIADESLV